MTSPDLIAVSNISVERHAADSRAFVGTTPGSNLLIRPDPQWAGDADRDSRDGRYPHADYTQLLVSVEDVEKAGEALHGRHRRSNW